MDKVTQLHLSLINDRSYVLQQIKLKQYQQLF